ncbi:Translation initiation factor 3 [hydrothermal vent metagenome]|uniref:Translation initiation factor 3 n=1 Tax=hydrothermal vent metagenome TaxID=652676 RepID=A0A3B0ZPH4_9ZZZZ
MKVRLNANIVCPEVRVVIGEGAESEQLGVLPIVQALKLATDKGLDLVEVSPNAEPPVCRIMDYGKYKFGINKKNQSAKKKQKQIQVKEIKFRPGTDIGDYQVKLRNLIRFLSDGDKAKVTMRFRGREMAHQEIGLHMLQRVEKDLADYGVVEQYPKMEGRQMVMVLGPLKQTKKS